MYENPVSKRVKKQNFIKTRVQAFQNNYQQSLKRIRTNSSMHSLAGRVNKGIKQVYNSKQNQLMSPKKTMTRPLSMSMLSKMEENPEHLKTSALKGLNTRASHIANYSDLNTSLILQRKNLEERHAFLKDQIAKEKRLKNKADTNCRKNQNDIEKSMNQIKQLTLRSERLNEGISQTRLDYYQNKRVFNENKNGNTEKNANIQRQLKYIQQLENRCRILKSNSLIEQKNKGNAKGELIKDQKVMKAASIRMHQLEQERANLLLQINQYVALNKIG